MNKTELQIEQTIYPKKNYYQECLNWSKDHILKKPNLFYFTSDTLRASYELECQETIPLESRVWGAVIRALSKENIIIFASTQMIKPASGLANHTRKTIWRKKENN